MRRWLSVAAAVLNLGLAGCDWEEIKKHFAGKEGASASERMGLLRTPSQPRPEQASAAEEARRIEQAYQYIGADQDDPGRRSFDGDARSYVDMGEDLQTAGVVQASWNGQGARPRAASVAFSDYRFRAAAAAPPSPSSTRREPGFLDRVRDNYHTIADWTGQQFTNVSLALGAPWAGRLKNGVPLPPRGEGYYFARYRGNWGTDALVRGIQWMGSRMKALGHQDMEVWDLSNKDGGQIRNHKSHQNGCDVDIAFYRTSRGFDTARNWDLLVSALENPHFQVSNVFVAGHLAGQLVKHGQETLGPRHPLVLKARSVMSHEPNHEDHFHIRIHPPRPGPVVVQASVQA